MFVVIWSWQRISPNASCNLYICKSLCAVRSVCSLKPITTGKPRDLRSTQLPISPPTHPDNELATIPEHDGMFDSSSPWPPLAIEILGGTVHHLLFPLSPKWVTGGNSPKLLSAQFFVVWIFDLVWTCSVLWQCLAA